MQLITGSVAECVCIYTYIHTYMQFISPVLYQKQAWTCCCPPFAPSLPACIDVCIQHTNNVR